MNNSSTRNIGKRRVLSVLLTAVLVSAPVLPIIFALGFATEAFADLSSFDVDVTELSSRALPLTLSEKPAEVTLTNTSSSTETLGAAISGTDAGSFVVSPAAHTFSPGESATFSVWYTGGVAGSFNASLDFTGSEAQSFPFSLIVEDTNTIWPPSDSWAEAAISNGTSFGSVDFATKTVEIEDEFEFGLISAMLKYDSRIFSGYTLKLMNDLTLSGKDWFSANAYGLTLDGGGHTISDLSIVENYTPGRSGMFGVFERGVVRNLVIEDPTITLTMAAGSGVSAGVVAGRTYGSQIRDIVISDPQISYYPDADSDSAIGVIVGYNGESDALDADDPLWLAWPYKMSVINGVDVNDGSITVGGRARNAYIGGAAGVNWRSGVDSVAVYGTELNALSTYSSSSLHIGGLAGYTTNTDEIYLSGSCILNCLSNKVEISAGTENWDSRNIGSIAGTVVKDNVANNVAIGNEALTMYNVGDNDGYDTPANHEYDTAADALADDVIAKHNDATENTGGLWQAASVTNADSGYGMAKAFTRFRIWEEDGADVRLGDWYGQVAVVNGTDNTNAKPYAAGEGVSITANTPPTGKLFAGWVSSGGGSFADATAATTTFTMPAATPTVTLTALYKSMSVGAQSGTPVYGTAGSATYTVTTENIPAYTAITLTNINSVSGISLVTTQTIGDSTVVTICTSALTPPGTHPLELNIAGLSSGSFNLTVSEKQPTWNTGTVAGPGNGGANTANIRGYTTQGTNRETPSTTEDSSIDNSYDDADKTPGKSTPIDNSYDDSEKTPDESTPKDGGRSLARILGLIGAVLLITAVAVILWRRAKLNAASR